MQGFGLSRPLNPWLSSWLDVSRCAGSLRSVGLGAAIAVVGCAFFGERADAAQVDHAKLASQLKLAVSAGDASRAEAVLDQLAADGSLKSFRIMIDVALAGANYPIERIAGALVASAEDPLVLADVYKQLQKHKNYRTRIVLAAIVGRLSERDPKAFDALKASLRDRSKPVLLSVLKVLRSLGPSARPCVPALIGLLKALEKKPRGRLYYDVRKTLVAVTEYDFEVSVDWENFWSAREGQKIPKRRHSGRTEVVRPTFFSVTVDSDRVYFLIDVSSSMTKRDPEKKPRSSEDVDDAGKGRTVVRGPKKRSPGTSGGGVSQPAAPLPPERERLYRAKKELVRVIEALPPNVQFGIASFSHEIKFWEGSRTLRPASPLNKTNAIRWVKGLRALGATRTDKALHQAMGLLDVDTVFVLTDGAPKNLQNQRLPIDPILEVTKSQNRFLRARIHTVSFSNIRDSRMRRFVTQLARENDGKSTFLD